MMPKVSHVYSKIKHHREHDAEGIACLIKQTTSDGTTPTELLLINAYNLVAKNNVLSSSVLRLMRSPPR